MTTSKYVRASMKQAASQAAKEFKSGRGRAWAWVSDHDAIIDAECMDQVRAAVYTGGTIDGAQVIEFRDAFVAAIAKMGFV